jgi:hypothetical protein
MPLVMVVMALTILSGLAAALVVGTMTETAVAAAYRQGVETFYAADGAVEFVVGDLAVRDDWDAVLTGAAASSFIDGPPGGTRRVGGRDIDLAQETAEVGAMLAARPAASGEGPVLHAYGRFEALLAGTAVTGVPGRGPAYICVWVAEGLPEEGPAEEALSLRLLYVVGRAYGPAGARRTVLVTLARTGDAADTPVEVRSWEEPQ